MKLIKKSVFVLLAMIISASWLYSEEIGAAYSRMYQRVTTLEQKYTIAKRLIAMEDPSIEPLINQIVVDLIQGDLSPFYETDRDNWIAFTRLMIQKAGDMKLLQSAGLIWRVAEGKEYSDPYLQTEAIIALGNMRASEYASDIANILTILNNNINEDDDNAEQLAYGSVYALAKMGDAEGFDAVFFCSVGWYQRWITDFAKEKLLTMMSDPTENIRSIIQNTTDFQVKLTALEVEQNSSASSANKISLAIEALNEGFINVGKNNIESNQLFSIRAKSIEILIENGDSSGESVELLVDIYSDQDTVQDEQQRIIQALGANGSDEAATALSDMLKFYNERMQSGVTPSRNQITVILEIIGAMSNSGNSITLFELSNVEISGYSNSIIRAANRAIDNIQ